MKKRRALIKYGLVASLIGFILTLLSYIGYKRGIVPITTVERERRQTMEITLPPPRLKSEVSVEEAIQRRRSKRKYYREPIDLNQLSNLLWSAQGITEPRLKFRAAPSAGATYPLEVYVAVGRGGVKGLKEGVYHYNPHTHTLELKFEGDILKELSVAAVNQSWVREAPINIIITAIYERTTRIYGERGIRYVHMEVGHVGENIYLQAVSLGLGTVVIGAFYDEEVSKLLKLPRNEKPLYILPVGKPAE